MQLVIKLPKSAYESIISGNFDTDGYFKMNLQNTFKEGKKLPKGHGRLIDADKTLAIAWQNFYKHEDEWEKKDENYLPIHRFYDQNGFECCQQTIVNALTIIEADKEEQHE